MFQWILIAVLLVLSVWVVIRRLRREAKAAGPDCEHCALHESKGK
ncbi:FeoB-associated Cys-rich membrane protein [bacterium]|nr:FeoB-associated Cys-rich membrane protein [bacterium]